MDERARLFRIIDELALPAGQWVLNGSGVMVMHGIERAKLMGDVDIFVSTRLWFSLLSPSYNQIPHNLDDPFVTIARSEWRVWTTEPDDELRRCDPPYLVREVCGLEVNVFSSWRRRGIGDFNAAELIAAAESVGGVPCVPLKTLHDWKLEMGRGKDLDDIRAIRERLGGVWG